VAFGDVGSSKLVTVAATRNSLKWTGVFDSLSFIVAWAESQGATKSKSNTDLSPAERESLPFFP